MRIWGILEELESLSSDRLNQELTNMNGQIRYIQEDMKWADYGAYGQDQMRIEVIRKDMIKIKDVLMAREIA
jgi:hypothetical protein